LFESGEFSAVDNLDQPILTVNAPIGLGFRDEPGDLVNRSIVQNTESDFVGLEVRSSKNLALIGGNINFDGGNLTARGGNIYLGGLSQAGTVAINQNGGLDFPEDVTQADVSLTNAAKVDVAGNSGGSIAIDARNLNIAAGELGKSSIQGGIGANFPVTEAQAGDITIDVAENMTIDDGELENQVDSQGIGNSGDIIIETGSLEVLNGSEISTTTRGQGDAGDVNITVADNIAIDGETQLGNPSRIQSSLGSDAEEGDAGNINITANNLALTNRGRVDVNTNGKGNAGNIEITAIENITIAGGDFERPSSIASEADSLAEGNGGSITLSVANLIVTDGGTVSATTEGIGDAGTIDINATEDVVFDGANAFGRLSSAISEVGSGAEGGSGGVNISTTNLNLTAGGRVGADTLGRGNAGTVDITATGDITADGENSEGFASGISSGVGTNAEGNSGGMTISTTNLNLTNGGNVNASTFGRGNAGAVNINASESIFIDGLTALVRSGISANAINQDGDGGDVSISTGNLSIVNGGTIEAANFDTTELRSSPGTGRPGNIEIVSNSIDLSEDSVFRDSRNTDK